MTSVTIGNPLRPDKSVWLGIRLMYDANPKYFITLMIAAVFEGLLPIVFIVLTGTLISATPPAVQSGSFSSPEGHHLRDVLIALAIVFVLQTALTSIAAAYRDGFRARFAAYRRERLMRATLSIPGIGHLEDSEYLDALRMAAATRDWPDPGTFSTAVFVYTSTRISAFLAAGVIAVRFNFLAALLLVVVWSIAGHDCAKDRQKVLTKVETIYGVAIIFVMLHTTLVQRKK